MEYTIRIPDNVLTLDVQENLKNIINAIKIDYEKILIKGTFVSNNRYSSDVGLIISYIGNSIMYKYWDEKTIYEFHIKKTISKQKDSWFYFEILPAVL